MSETKKLDERQLESRKEIVIPINPKALWNAYTKLFYDKPIEGLQWVAKKIDDFAIHKRMRSGIQSVVSMPIGIMLRNGARATHQLAEGKYLHTSQWLGGGAAALSAWWVAGSALNTALAGTFVSSIGGSIATVATAAALTVPVVVPAAMIGVAVFSAAVGLAITGVSALPAALNIKTGLLRTLDRIKGIKDVVYDGPAEEKAISYDSLRAREERKLYSEVRYSVQRLSEEHQKEIFDSLTERFGKVAAPANNNQQQPVAVPAAKAKSAPTP